MSIRMTIEISVVATGPKNEFGVGVRVITDGIGPYTPDGEGATFCGIGMAINDYMRSRGVPDFDCLKPANRT